MISLERSEAPLIKAAICDILHQAKMGVGAFSSPGISAVGAGEDLIEVDNLTVKYSQRVALRGLSFRVRRGEFILLTGPSGCGKSTLARCLVGLIPHSSLAQMTGRVVVDGLATMEHSVSELATHVGLVFQNPATQLFCLTVEEEVAFGPRNLGLPPQEVAERCRFALAATGIEHLRRRRVNSLSCGEQQRVAIAAVLAMRPNILVLDEPTSNLDLKGTKRVLETLDRLRREHGLTILVIEHRLGEVGRLADRVMVMNEGRIVADGTPQQVFGQRGLLAELGIRYPWHVLEDGWAALVPRGIAGHRPKERPLVELQGVEAGYGRTTVLSDLNLAIYPGEFVALVGDNGVGKTTVAKVLAGLLKPRRGKVIFHGGARELGRRVGLVFQNPLSQLFCRTVGEEVAFGPRNFGILSEGLLEEILVVAGLSELRDRRVHALSSGQQQRTALAAVFALRPELLILDEPTMGQDWGHLGRFMDFLVELNGRGSTILLITHDYKLVCRYARRVMLLRDGRIVADGPPRSPARGSAPSSSGFVAKGK